MVLLVVVVVLAALLPVAHRVQRDSGQLVSASNLQKIALAHAQYANDWNDRQVTWVPDDLGLIGGNFQTYASVSGFGCPPSMQLGFDENGGMWGFFLPCDLGLGTWGNSVLLVPNTFNMANIIGSFRQIGARAFAPYIDGRYYSPLLYAPNDTITIQRAAPYLDLPIEFTVLPSPNDDVVLSSYALSPAAMWDPQVLSKDPDSGLWWRNPTTLPIGYRSPTVSTCLHPELKTRTIEHNWNFGQPAPVNPNFIGGQTPYFYSHGIDAAPITLFFDGRVAELPNAQVAADDAAVLASTGGEVGLWTRDTPLGNSGYYGGSGWDDFVTGHHLLTAGGILGRDVLSTAAAPPSGVAGAASAAGGRDRVRAPLRRDRPRTGSEGAPIDPPFTGFLPQEGPSW